MKKQLSFLGALLLSSAVTASTAACNSPIVVAKDLKDVLIKTDLGCCVRKATRNDPNSFWVKKEIK